MSVGEREGRKEAMGLSGRAVGLCLSCKIRLAHVFFVAMLVSHINEQNEYAGERSQEIESVPSTPLLDTFRHVTNIFFASLSGFLVYSNN